MPMRIGMHESRWSRSDIGGSGLVGSGTRCMWCETAVRG